MKEHKSWFLTKPGIEVSEQQSLDWLSVHLAGKILPMHENQYWEWLDAFPIGENRRLNENHDYPIGEYDVAVTGATFLVSVTESSGFDYRRTA